MTTIDRVATIPSLTASIEERILAPLRRNAAANRTWFTVTLVAILCLHGAILAFLLYRDHPEAPVAPEPTPVEVVVEQPKEPPKPAPEPPKEKPKPEVEKPAMSAPRAPNDEKVDTTETDKENHAPTASVQPKAGQPTQAKDASPPDQPTAAANKAEDAAAKPDVLKADAEALDKAAPKPMPKPKKLAKQSPKPKHGHATALQQLASASPLPDYTFARPTKRSPVYGGTEDSRYLAIVYGMIMQHRAPVDIPSGAGGSVTVAFNVDGEGNLIGLGVEKSSGYPQVDAEAVAAIRRAQPFPPPPSGAPHGLIATIDLGEATPVYTMGSRAR